MRPRLPLLVPFLLCWPCLVPLPGQERGQDRRLAERGSMLQVVDADRDELDLRTTPVVRAVQRAADAVVSIYIQSNAGQNGGNVAAGNGPGPEGQGSGVILDNKGFVITNWHVVAPVLQRENIEILVKLRDGRSRTARVLSTSIGHDLALLQLGLREGEAVQPVSLGRSSELMIGESVIAIGNPQGHANTVTSGVLSATGRSIQVLAPDGRMREYRGLLQTDAAINRGNSGGALLDITGKLIGVNNAMAAGAENIGFAIPVDTVREVFEKELIAGDSLVAGDAPWLGLDVVEREGAVLVANVVEGGPAAEAGVRVGDRLVQIAGQPVQSRLDFLRTLLLARSRQPLAMTLRRGNRAVEVSPAPIPRTSHAIEAMIGLRLSEITAAQDRELLHRATLKFYGNRFGRWPLLPVLLQVDAVAPDSPGAALGLRQGDHLLALVDRNRFGGEVDVRIDSLADLRRMLEASGRSVRVVVLRGEQDLVGDLDVRPLGDK